MKTQRNTTFLFAALFFLAGNIKAQNPSSSPSSFRLGFKIQPTLNFNKIMEGNLANNGAKLGFSYGLMGDFNLGGNPNYWLAVEALISSMPASVKATDTLINTSSGFPVSYNNVSFDYKLQYVQVPVSIKFKTNEIGQFSYWFQFGTAPSILIQNKLTTNSNPSLYSTSVKSHAPNRNSNDAFDFNGENNNGRFIDDVVPVRVPLILGAGMEFRISGKTYANAGLRWDNAFTDLFLDKNVKARNNYLGLQIGIFF